MRRWKVRSVLPPKKPCTAPVRTTDRHADSRERQTEKDIQPEAVDQQGQQVAAALVGAQQVVARGAPGKGSGEK